VHIGGFSSRRINFQAFYAERVALSPRPDGAVALILNPASDPNIYYLRRAVPDSSGTFTFARGADPATLKAQPQSDASTVRSSDVSEGFT
jgi:hypothetical protein